MSHSTSQGWPAIPEIHLHPTDLPRDELPEETKGWLLFVRVGQSAEMRSYNQLIICGIDG